MSRGNRHDSTQLESLLDRIPHVSGVPGGTRRRPDCLLADRGYDYARCRQLLRRRGIKRLIARRQTEHGSGLGTQRWVVERTFAWLPRYRRLTIRYERHAHMHEAFLALACCLICWKHLTPVGDPSSAFVSACDSSDPAIERGA